MRTSMLVLLVACGGGQSPPGPDGPPDEPFESAQFLPQFCTGGQPDEPTAPNPNCLVNRIPINQVTVVGAEVSFVVRPLATGVMFDRLEISAGPSGLYVEHPQFLFGDEVGGDPYANFVRDLAPGATVTLDASTLIIEDTTAKMVVRFEVMGPFRQ